MKIIYQKKHPFTYPEIAEEKADALKAEHNMNRGKQRLNQSFTASIEQIKD